MLSVYYVGKRTLFDILRTGVFWGAFALAGFICFSLLYWGWHQMKIEIEREHPKAGRTYVVEDGEMQGAEGDFNPFERFNPRHIILWWTYGIIIGFANLLSIFVMIGLISREVERHTIDSILARPVSRGQMLAGKMLAGWAASIAFMALMVTWCLICMGVGGVGIQKGFVPACVIGTLSPCVIGAVTLFLSIWMRGLLAGLIGTVLTFGSSTTGLLVIKAVGVELLKLKWAVWVVFKMLPPLNVIGEYATNHLQKDINFRMLDEVFESILPTPADGLYTELWQVAAYLAVVVVLGYLSFFRRQFA